jgi:integrase
MSTVATPFEARKIPFPTVMDFTVANIKHAMSLVREHELPQVQFCSKTDRGFHAMVYPNDVTFYANYSLPRRLGIHPRRTGRIQVGVYGLHTIAQAHAEYLDVRRKAYAGIDPKEKPLAALMYGEFHIDHYRAQCISSQKKSLKTDIQRYQRWIAPDFADVPLPKINATLVHKLIIKMQEAGRAAATIRNVIGLFSSSLNLAVELGLLEKNPIKTVKLPKVNNLQTDTMAIAEVSAFILAANRRKETVASRLLTLLAFTGARLGEATNAKWVDIDLERGYWVLPTQKSGKPGVIYLSEAAKNVIRDVLPFKRNDYVFPGEKGNEKLSRPIRLFKRILKDAGVTGTCRIHTLRHAWCSNLIEAGVPIEIVSQGARHSSPVVTRRYIHPQADAMTAANERLAELLAA